jgi:hypothetical protein
VTTAQSEDPVDILTRWESFGGTWEVVSCSSEELTVSLRRCDGGEEVSRLTSAAPELRRYVEGRGPRSRT